MSLFEALHNEVFPGDYQDKVRMFKKVRDAMRDPAFRRLIDEYEKNQMTWEKATDGVANGIIPGKKHVSNSVEFISNTIGVPCNAEFYHWVINGHWKGDETPEQVREAWERFPEVKEQVVGAMGFRNEGGL